MLDKAIIVPYHRGRALRQDFGRDRTYEKQRR